MMNPTLTAIEIYLRMNCFAISTVRKLAMARNPGRSRGKTGGISIGGNVASSALATGHKNTQTVTYTAAAPVEVIEALHLIRTTLEGFSGPSKDASVHANTAIKEASAERPDKDTIGGALKRALEVAKGSAEFAGAAVKIAPYVRTVVGWLGGPWNLLIGLLG
jgi:hypothetical protein